MSDEPRRPHPDETQTWLLTVGANGAGHLGVSIEVGGVAVRRRHMGLTTGQATAALMVVAGLAALVGFHDDALDLPVIERPAPAPETDG